MDSELAHAGVVIYNWPEGCRHPNKESTKGIAELTTSEQTTLMDALVHPQYRLYFLKLDDMEKRKGKLVSPIRSLALVLI
jgi:hypothetical protein